MKPDGNVARTVKQGIEYVHEKDVSRVAPTRVPARAEAVWNAVAGSACFVTAVVIFLNGAWLLQMLHTHHGDARYIVYMGRKFAEQSHASPVIRYVANLRTERTEIGYDGQFYYFIAMDPLHAKSYMDWTGPVYHYTRIVYPMLSRILALGKAAVIPWTPVIVNWLALGLGTWAVAAWLKRHGISSWFALIFGLYPGLLFGLSRDLTEPLGYALAALAVYLFERGGKTRYFGSSLVFALAILTRETVVVFPVLYGLALLFPHFLGLSCDAGVGMRTTWKHSLVFLSVALLPFAIYKVFLLAWLHSLGLVPADGPQFVPFGGLWAQWPWDTFMVLQVIAVSIPGTICAGVAVGALIKGRWSVEVGVLMANVLFFVVMLNPITYSAYEGSGRVTAGVVLGALYCLPVFDEVYAGNRWWLWAAASCWLVYALFYLSLIPVWILGPVLYLVVMAILTARRDASRQLAHAA